MHHIVEWKSAIEKKLCVCVHGYACLDELVFVNTFYAHIICIGTHASIEMACNGSVVNLHISFPKMRIHIIALELK